MGAKTGMTRRTETVSVSDYDHKRPEEIRNDIQQTRTNISHTVDLLQERLDPERLKGEAREKVRGATIGRLEDMADDMGRKAKRMRYSVTETIKENPIPAALVGLGLGWLLMEGFNRSPERSYYDEDDYWYEERYYPVGEGVYVEETYEVEPYAVGDEYRSRSQIRESFDEARERTGYAAGRARDRAEEMGQQARAKASEMGQRAKDQAEHIGSEMKERVEYLGEEARQQVDYLSGQARRQARRAKGQFEYALEENPLAVGAAALALGVALGLSVPETRYEDEYFGPTRDDLLDKAQDKAEDVMHKVEHVASEAGKSATQTAKEEAERQNLKSPSGSTFTGTTSTGTTSTRTTSTGTTSTGTTSTSSSTPSSTSTTNKGPTSSS